MRSSRIFVSWGSAFSALFLLTSLGLLMWFFLSAQSSAPLAPPLSVSEKKSSSPAPSQTEAISVGRAVFSGVDDQKRPFSIMAEHAAQNTPQADLGHIFLQGVSGTFFTSPEMPSSFSAQTALYLQSLKIVELNGQIILEQKNKGTQTPVWTLRLPKAHLNLENRTLQGQGPVEAILQNGTIHSQSIVLDESGDHILFSGHVSGVFYETYSEH